MLRTFQPEDPQDNLLEIFLNYRLNLAVRKYWLFYASSLGTEMQHTLHTPLDELLVRSSDVFNTHPLGHRVGIGFADHGIAIVGTA